MEFEYYPIGTVVILKNGTKPVMIYGRKQLQAFTEKVWDYVGCLYPEGNINEKYNVFFQHFEIDKVLYGICNRRRRRIRKRIKKSMILNNLYIN